MKNVFLVKCYLVYKTTKLQAKRDQLFHSSVAKIVFHFTFPSRSRWQRTVAFNGLWITVGPFPGFWQVTMPSQIASCVLVPNKWSSPTVVRYRRWRQQRQVCVGQIGMENRSRDAALIFEKVPLGALLLGSKSLIYRQTVIQNGKRHVSTTAVCQS